MLGFAPLPRIPAASARVVRARVSPAPSLASGVIQGGATGSPRPKGREHKIGLTVDIALLTAATAIGGLAVLWVLYRQGAVSKSNPPLVNRDTDPRVAALLARANASVVHRGDAVTSTAPVWVSGAAGTWNPDTLSFE